jgi:hypothetical protein
MRKSSLVPPLAESEASTSIVMMGRKNCNIIAARMKKTG